MLGCLLPLSGTYQASVSGRCAASAAVSLHRPARVPPVQVIVKNGIGCRQTLQALQELE
jgi:hypothetical protein